MKKFCAAVFALMFVATTASISFGAKVKCEVTEVKDDMVMLKCEKPEKFKAGDKLKVSTAKKGAAVEGC